MRSVIEVLHGVPVVISERIPRDNVVFGSDIAASASGLVVMIHPLEDIALRHRRDPHARLDEAMAWIVMDANRKLDALSRRIAEIG